jgi:hypothetical protein
VIVTRKVKQTKFKKEDWEGLLTIHDSGKFAASMDHKSLFLGLNHEPTTNNSYIEIAKPTTKEKTTILDRLFDKS